VRTTALALAVGALAPACNEPEIPPELLEAIERSASGTPWPGPYGTRVGDVTEERCFEGWRDPAAAGYDPARFERICFSDWWDPGARGALLVNTAAVWCTACRQEWCGTGARESLSAQVAARAGRGLAALGLLFENARGDRASESDLRGWAAACEVTIPFGLDADFVMGAYADKSVQPFNMVLDRRTMKIVEQVNGDQPDLLFAAIDGLLGE
jgi:hypothetical protein